VAADALHEQLVRFHGTYRESPELAELLHNPAFESERERVLKLVLDKLGVTDEVRGLLRLLAERNRVDLVDEICREVEAIADERQHRLRAHVVSAVPLSEAQQGRIVRALEKRHGQTVVVSANVDARILGGLVCRIGDLTLDSSLKHQLDSLRERLEHDA
jgi:F-type H+-transporting ATPase subunit delta